jgi:hypothetical protein
VRWPWGRCHPQPLEDATAAVEQAQRSLVDAKNFESRVARVSDDLTETLRRNHFGAAVRQAMRGV